jgi:transposase
MPARRDSILSDEQWLILEPMLPKLEKPPGQNRGGRPWRDNRECLEGIIWLLRTGARWRDIPPVLPSGSTCWRRLRAWQEADVWQRIWAELLRLLDEKGRLDLSETYIDATFRAAKKGATELGLRSVERAKRRNFL